MVGEKKRSGRMALVLLAALVLAAQVAQPAAAAPADLDRSFGDGGATVVEGPSGPQFRSQAPPRMAVGPDGKIFVLYANTAPCEEFSGCSIEWSLAEFSADGARDTQFGAGAGSTLSVHGNEYEPGDLAVGPDGKPVVAVLDRGKVVVARFDLGGHLETIFGAGESNALFGGAYTPPVVAVQGDGKVVVAVGSGSELRIVRYMPSGERDSGFGNAGEAVMALATQSRPAGLLLGASGAISIAAPKCCGGSALFGSGISFARLLANGQPDPGLAGSGQLLFPTPGAEGTVEAAALAPDGGIYIVFEVDAGNVATAGNVVKFRPDGSLDTAFGKGGLSRIPISVDDLAVDGKGRLIAGGWSGSAAVFRMRPGGGADRTFDGGDAIALRSSGPATLALQKGGRIVVAGEPCCGPKSLTLYRLVGGTDHTRCLGHKATIVGTSGPDELTGTPHRDVIAALGGKDKVRALGGADVICGGKGRDVLLGGPGRDVVR